MTEEREETLGELRDQISDAAARLDSALVDNEWVEAAVALKEILAQATALQAIVKLEIAEEIRQLQEGLK